MAANIALALAGTIVLFFLAPLKICLGCVIFCLCIFFMINRRSIAVLIKVAPRDLRFIRFVIRGLSDLKSTIKIQKNLHNVFTTTVSRHPDKVAVLFEDQSWTFRELDCFANQVGHLFLEHGLKKGDTVAMFMENCPEYIGLWLGLSKIGVKASFINYNLREAALFHCLSICQPKTIIYTGSLGEALAAVHGDLDETLYDSIYFVRGEDKSVPKSQSLSTKLSSQPDNSPPLADLSIHDTVFYIYTSGTTGLPKAVPISHQRFLTMAVGIRHLLGCPGDHVMYLTLPLYHTNGGILGTGWMIWSGHTLALRRKFSASQFWNDCIKYKCTEFLYIGELCRYLLAQPKKPTDTQHRITQIAGNGLRPQIWTEFKTRFNISNIFEFYGSTEGNASMANMTNKPGSCGFIPLLLKFMYPVTLLKVDEEGQYVRNSHGFIMQPDIGEPGEVVGKIISTDPTRRFDGYTNHDATQKKIVKDVFKKGDAYFKTGDMMRMDEEGNLYFCDRTGDTFRWKGENVSTTEVEGAIGRILEMREVVVVGVDVPGAEGKAGMACIVGNEQSVDVEGLAEKVYRALPPYAVPLFVRLMPQADLTGTFKFQKTRLRNEGYDVAKVTDPLFIMDKKTYVPLDTDKYHQLQNGQLRL